MANHGGFGIAVQLNERIVNDVLWVLQRSDVIPKAQAIHTSVPGGTIHLDLYIDAPVASFSAASSNDFDLKVRTFGTLVIDAPDVDAAPRKVRIDLKGRGDLDAHVEQGLNPPTIDTTDWLESPFHYELLARFSDFVVLDNTFSVVEGADLPDQWKDFFAHWNGGPLGVRVTRVLEGEEEVVWTQAIELKVQDRLDRGRKYVKWKHLVITPDVMIQPDGSHKLVGKRIFVRSSLIHRTRWPGRCLFADRYSGDKGLELEYLDDLPFPLAELTARRGLVCDFCFFGGPDKNEPLVKDFNPPGGGLGGLGKKKSTVRKPLAPGSAFD